MLPEHGNPLACELFHDPEKLNRRLNRRKLLGEFQSKLHVGLRYFQQLRLIGPRVCRGGRTNKLRL